MLKTLILLLKRIMILYQIQFTKVQTLNNPLWRLL